MQTDLRKKILGIALSAALAVSLLPQMQVVDVSAAGSSSSSNKTNTAAATYTVSKGTAATHSISYSVTVDESSDISGIISSENTSRDDDNKLIYDADLQSLAIKRAEEIAIYCMPNKRPDGTSGTATYRYDAENVASDKKASEVASILDNKTYRYTGIGHVIYGGKDYWVQVFSTSGSESNFSATIPYNETVQRTIAATAINGSFTVTQEPASFSIVSGDSQNLPTVSSITMATETNDSCIIKGVNSDNLSWTSGLTEVATVSGTKVTGNNLGTSELAATLNVTDSVKVDLKASVTVTARAIDGAYFVLNSSYPLSGGKAEPKPTIKLPNGTSLTENVDYTLSYTNNTKEGTGTVTATGIGRFTGKATANFAITSEIGGSLATNGKVELAKNEVVTYDGTEKTPEVKVLFSGTEISKDNYTVSYSNNINAGTATITVTGAGSLYTGSKTGTFKIEPASLATATIEFKEKSFPYTADAVRPEMTVKIGDKEIDPENYTASYTNNTKISTSSSKASVTITGTKNCKDSKKQEFEIGKGTLNGGTVTALNVGNSAFEPVYSGTVQKPGVVKVICAGATKALTEGTDYTLTYSEDLINAGTVTMTATGKGNFEGSTITGTYTIEPKDIAVLNVSKPAAKVFTGKELKQTVTVTDGSKRLNLDTDYTVGYMSNVYPGKGTVVVTMQGNYKGSLEQTFNISIKKPTISSLSSTSGRFTVKWKKVSGTITGYQIKYGTKKVKVKKSKSGLTVKGLKSKKKYTVKVRAYYTDDTGTYYGSYSAGKTITIK